MNQPGDKQGEVMAAKLAEQSLRIYAVNAMKASGLTETEASEKVRMLFKALRPTLSSCAATVPEGCTPTDAKVLREGNFQLATENQRLREALRFYANRQHWTCEGAARLEWDTVSGEPQNWHWRENATDDAEGIEDGEIARSALRGENVDWDGDSPPVIEGEPEWHIEQAAKASAVPESGRTVDKSGEYDADLFDSGRDSMADDVLDILNAYRDQFTEDERIEKVRALCREQLVSAPHKDHHEGKGK